MILGRLTAAKQQGTLPESDIQHSSSGDILVTNTEQAATAWGNTTLEHIAGGIGLIAKSRKIHSVQQE